MFWVCILLGNFANVASDFLFLTGLRHRVLSAADSHIFDISTAQSNLVHHLFETSQVTKNLKGLQKTTSHVSVFTQVNTWQTKLTKHTHLWCRVMRVPAEPPSSSCLRLPLPGRFDLLFSNLAVLRLNTWYSSLKKKKKGISGWINQYLFPDKGHDSDPGEDMLTRQPLSRDAVGEGLCSVGPRLT